MAYAYPQYMQPPPRRSAPVSVHFIAVLYYLAGAFYLLAAAGAGALAATGHLDGPIAQLSHRDQRSVTLAGIAVLGVLGLITMWFGRRLQKGRNWARVLLNFLLILTVAGIAYATWRAQDTTVLIALIQPAFYLTLLNTRAARSWFKHHTW